MYFESFSFAVDAFAREKQVIAGSRKKKVALIESINSEWRDLSEILNPGSMEELIRRKKFFR